MLHLTRTLRCMDLPREEEEDSRGAADRCDDGGGGRDDDGGRGAGHARRSVEGDTGGALVSCFGPERDSRRVAESSNIGLRHDPECDRAICAAVELAPPCGDDGPDAHRWRPDASSGCSENPGIHSLGGTVYSCEEVCAACGATRTVVQHGAQRDPGQCDSVEYTAADPKTWSKS